METAVEIKKTLSKAERFEEMKESRPRLIIEAFSAGDGLLLDGVIRGWFTDAEDDHKDFRYMSVDPEPIDFGKINSMEWGLGVRGRVEEVVRDKKKVEGLEEVWVKNAGSLVDKKAIWDKVLDVLPRGGKLIIYDDYTTGLPRELGALSETFGDGVEIDNFTGRIEAAEHPLLKRLYENQRKDGAVALVITKK